MTETELFFDGEEELTGAELYQKYIRLLYHWAKPYTYRHDPEDMLQEAALALIQAARKFDIEAGASFKTFASQQVGFHLGGINRRGENGIKISQGTQTIRFKITRAGLWGHSDAEISRELDCTEKAVQLARQAEHTVRQIALDKPSPSGDEAHTLADMFGQPDDLTGVIMDELHGRLTSTERALLAGFLDGESQTMTGRRLGLKQRTVSRRWQDVKAKIIDYMEEAEA